MIAQEVSGAATDVERPEPMLAQSSSSREGASAEPSADPVPSRFFAALPERLKLQPRRHTLLDNEVYFVAGGGDLGQEPGSVRN